jgi:O-acetyl-ADP-ribose deacetylase (regulator of RNase III)
MKKPDINSLYYITHIHNLPSILQYGLWSHQQVADSKVPYTPIYDRDIVNQRQHKATPAQKSLWEYTNLYFQPRNPMMYRVIQTLKREIAVVGIKPEVLNSAGGLITDGNATSGPTQFFSLPEGLTVIQQQWPIIQNHWWNEADGSKRKIMAECLIPNPISPTLIHSIFVVDMLAKEQVEAMVGTTGIPVIAEPQMFFQPRFATRIGNNLSLIDGDMFFSNQQTLTISVNLQGVMGKGLASRAKYQFPDVYIVYQDVCRHKQLRVTKPYLYKREMSFDQELSDISLPEATPNAVKWFLLFATKRRWQEHSRLDDLESGLDWVRNNYQQEKIQSLALPALGCGLGHLTWAEVGPLMCRYLEGLEIPVAIYLPREDTIDSKHLLPEYLLKSAS